MDISNIFQLQSISLSCVTAVRND